MKKKIGLFILLIVLGTLIWYLFIKPYDYLVTFKANTFPGTINQTIKLWSKTIDPNFKITQSELQNVSQKLTINDTTYYYNWKIKPITDSTSKVKVYVKDVDHSLVNKIKIPFSETDFEKTTKRILLDFNEKLTEHIKKFKVKIIGKDTFAGKYCVYVPIKTTQLQKAKGMKQNYLFLSDFVASNNIELNGTPLAEITKWDLTTDSIHYNFCYPIIKPDSLPIHNLIKYKQLDIKPSLKANYNGNYITSDRAWYSLIDYAKKSNIEIIPKPIEVYNNNPNYGGDELRWKTEVYMPIK
jgi:effector-binding domain-containing protein